MADFNLMSQAIKTLSGALAGGVLLADIDLVKIVIFGVVILFWIIGQFREVVKKANKPPSLPPVRPTLVDVPQRKAEKTEINQQIEEFLRRSSEARRGQSSEPQRAVPVVIQPQSRDPQRKMDTPRSQPSRGSNPVRTLSPSASSPKVEVVEKRDSISKHVSEVLDNKKFSDRATHLGTFDDVAPRSDKFSHEISHLQTHIARDTRPAEAAAEAAVNRQANASADLAVLVGMLRNPKSIRNAILMAEILTPRVKY